MSRLRKAENEFVFFAINTLKSENIAIDGVKLLNQFISDNNHYILPSRRQLLTTLRKHNAIYARVITKSGLSKTFYSLSPILSGAHKNDGSGCNSRRYKKPSLN
jgi:hypothetical protein